MCGFILVRVNNEIKIIDTSSLHKRGPDNYQKLEYASSNYKFSFEFFRLIINDISKKGNQPFQKDGVILMCNGEIYNHSILKKEYKFSKFQSKSDCEVIIDLYKKVGIEKTLSLLDGVFAFVLYDTKTESLYIARDRIGVRPVFYTHTDECFAFSSLAAPLESLKLTEPIQQLNAGSFMIVNGNSITTKKYYTLPKRSYKKFTLDKCSIQIWELLVSAVNKRLMSDRPIGCLLSGGVDSSIVASILSRIYKKKIKTFSIGFPGSTDLIYAKKVADYIKSDHYSIEISYEKGLKAIDEVIKNIETYDITTIRASIGMYLLSEYIKINHPEKVIFSGEGADELLAGYLYFHNAPNNTTLFRESQRLVKELPYYDVLRADRSTSSHGLELRVPFLDKDFVEYVMSLPAKFRKPVNGYEKYILRKAFAGDIPDDVLWRRKEGFSDGVSSMKKPWYKYIQEHLETKITDDELKWVIKYKKDYNLPDINTKEALYYYKVYLKHFKKLKLIDGYWLPKWCKNNKEPSGRIVNFEKNNK